MADGEERRWKMTEEKLRRANEIENERFSLLRELESWTEKTADSDGMFFEHSFVSNIARDLWVERFAEFQYEVITRIKKRIDEISVEFDGL
jgi:hypothetical protein